MDPRVRPTSMRLLLVTAAVVTAMCTAAHAQNAPAPTATAMVDSTRIPVGDSPSQGPRDALVTIVEFGNPVDLYTARLQPVLAAIRARYPTDVRIVWKNHPRTLSLTTGDRLADAM